MEVVKMNNKLKKIALILFVCLIAVMLLIQGNNLLGSKIIYAQAPSSVVNITVQNTVKGTITEGVGYNVESIWMSENKINGPLSWSGDEWTTYTNLIKFLKPKIVRLGVNLPSWSPSYNTYTYNSEWMQNAYKLLDLFKSINTNVILANWWTSGNYPDNFWWSETTRNGSNDPDGMKRNDHPYDADKFAEAIAHCVEYLRNTKNYTNIKYVSIWNEPDWNYVSATARYPYDVNDGENTFWPLYSKLSAALTSKGVRSSVGIVGPETSWIGRFGPPIKTYVKNPESGKPQQFGQVVDQIAVHDYDSLPDYDTRTFDGSRDFSKLKDVIDTCKDIRTSVDNTYTSNGKTAPPFFITEIGNPGYGGYYDDASAVGNDGLFLSEMEVRYLAEGFDATMRWNLTTTTQADIFDTVFRPIDFDGSTNTFKIRGEAYYSNAVIARYLERNSSVYNFSISGAGDPQRVFVAPIKGNDNQWTILFVNNDYEDRQVNLDISALGISDGTNFYEFEWRASDPNGIRCNQALKYKGKKISIPLKARSVMSFTMRGGSDFTSGAMLTVNPSTGGITTTPGTNPVTNGGFETGNLNGWSSTGSVAVQNDAKWSHTGSYFLTHNTSVNSSEVYQTISGLSQGNYMLRVRVRTSGNNTATVGVRNFDGAKNYSENINSTDFYTASIYFTIPSGGNSAVIYSNAPYAGNNTWVNIDDFEVIPVKEELLNGGFEKASPLYWTASGSACREETAYARSGSAVATISTSQASGSFSQTVSGLTPGTYSFTGFLRSGGGVESKIEVSNYGGSTKSATTTDSSWRRVRIIFTIPSGYSSATLTYSAPYKAGTTWSNGDDFELRRLKAPLKFKHDPLDDFSKIYSRSSNLAFDSSNKEYVAYDESRLYRTTKTSEYIIYNVPSGENIKSFNMGAWFWPNETITDFTISVSSDGSSYSTITPVKKVVSGASGGYWHRVEYYRKGDLPSGTKYLKITFPNASQYNWNPQLTYITIWY